MDTIIDFISGYINYWPAVVFLAGLNIPVSEDIIIILSAGMVEEGKAPLVPTLVAIYSGVVISDIMVYWEGYAVSKGLLNFNWMKKMMASNKVKVLGDRLEKHCLLTFITTRFIPIGVRNALFFTSGLLNLKFTKFLRCDLPAALLSNMTLFWLVYIVGKDGGSGIMRNVGLGILGLMIILIVVSILRMNKATKKVGQENAEEGRTEPTESTESSIAG